MKSIMIIPSRMLPMISKGILSKKDSSNILFLLLVDDDHYTTIVLKINWDIVPILISSHQLIYSYIRLPKDHERCDY